MNGALARGLGLAASATRLAIAGSVNVATRSAIVGSVVVVTRSAIARTVVVAARSVVARSVTIAGHSANAWPARGALGVACAIAFVAGGVVADGPSFASTGASEASGSWRWSGGSVRSATLRPSEAQGIDGDRSGRAGVRNRGSRTYLRTPVQSGYPAPAQPTSAPTATPPPDAAGRYPAPAGVVVRFVGRAEAEADGLGPVLEVVGGADARALSMLAGPLLRVDPPWATEGWGLRLEPSSLRSLLAAALPATAEGEQAAVAQGYFGAGCRVESAPCSFGVVVTGLRADIISPARATGETTGPMSPTMVPTTAAWELVPDGGGSLWWRAWRAHEAGYHALVEALASEGWGEFTVLR